MLALLAVLTLGVAPAVGGADQTQVVVKNGSGFAIETLDGTVMSSVAAAPGTFPGSDAAAADGSIVYDDRNGSTGTGGEGPVWLVGPNRTPLELDSSPDDFDASISYDGSRVTFARYDSATGSSDIYVVNADGSGLALVKSGEGSNYLISPEFSPDGDSLAYICGPASSPLGSSLGCGPTAAGTYYQNGILLMNADGTGTRMIVAAQLSGNDGESLAWSPDGQSIATTGCVTSHVDNVWSCGPPQVFVYGTDGSDLLKDDDPTRQVTNETGPATPILDPEFTPEGSAIVFIKVVDNQWASFSIDRDGTNEHQLGVPPGFEVIPPVTGGGPSPVVDLPDPSVTGAGVPVVFRSTSTLPQCNGFIVEAGDGALTDCVPVSTGALTFRPDTRFTVATDDSIVYDDVNEGPTDVNGDLLLGAGPVWLVGPNRTPLELDSSPYDFDAAISSEGSEVTFARLDPVTHGSDLYVVNADGSGLTRVASGGGNNFLSSPKFSPDRGSIAYLCSAAGFPLGTGLGCGPTAAGRYAASGVMLMNADGSDQRMIVIGAEDAGDPIVNGGNNSDSVDTLSWSPDAKWVTVPGCLQLVPDVSNECNSDQAFAYRTDGTDVFKVLDPSSQVTHEAPSPAAAVEPQFCGNSTQILFQKSWFDGFSEPSSYLVDRDGTNRHEISLWPGSDPGQAECVPPATGGVPATTVNVAQSSPFPSGQVVLASTNPQCSGFLAESATYAFTMCVQGNYNHGFPPTTYDVAADDSVVYIPTSNSDNGPIWLSRPGERPVVLDSSPYDTDPAISYDGSKVAFVRIDPNAGDSDLYVGNADGSELKRVASRSGTERLNFPAFSPDGSSIAYVDGTHGVVLVKVDGSNARMILKGQTTSEPLSWSPDGHWLAMNTGGQVYAYRTDGSDLYNELDTNRQVTHERGSSGANDPQFGPDGSQILYQRGVDDSGDQGLFSYVIDRDGSNRQEVFLSPDPLTCTPAGTDCSGKPAGGIFVPPAKGGSVPKPVKPTQATVPNVHALSHHAATRRLRMVRLTGTVTQRRFSSRIKRGHVISQYPRARTQASLKKKRSRVVKLVLSRGRRPRARR